ncbi:hypothetical protein BJ875DRAFT_72373 [Amylocarpus encephaloides]|uniref:Zn(2)-C6 fungal-type domain-containing protein n=1 Tax=Amylocarpus encephaloides TaxID=45428 RepID=A0A9P7YF12_9HELO|nr:hypothetical protein BJ875DRAFT_72373 [Amylocarpus encephaloides]
MPGVPNGRACEGCRKQKKKCDEKTPSCGRCTRLALVCVGSGQQRFKFKEHQALRSSQKTKPPEAKIPGISVIQVYRIPKSELTLLATSFIQTISPTTDIRYNLAWTYGIFLEEIPRRLGKNEALDTSIAALVSSHSSFCAGQKISVDALMKYSHALKALRNCLDDRSKAHESETLCSVMILMICQSFIGIDNGVWTGHSEGATQLLKARGYLDIKDDFECKLLLSLRGPVLFESLFNAKINFSSWEWQTFVENPLDGDTLEGKMMHSLTRVPGFMLRRRKQLQSGIDDPSLVDEVRSNYDNYQPVLAAIRERLMAIRLSPPIKGFKGPDNDFISILLERAYGIGLTIGIILNQILSAIDVGNTDLASESTFFAKEIMILNESAPKHGPVGGGYIELCLVAVLLGTNDEAIIAHAEEEFANFYKNMRNGHKMSTKAALEKTRRRILLLDVGES